MFQTDRLYRTASQVKHFGCVDDVSSVVECDGSSKATATIAIHYVTQKQPRGDSAKCADVQWLFEFPLN